MVQHLADSCIQLAHKTGSFCGQGDPGIFLGQMLAIFKEGGIDAPAFSGGPAQDIAWDYLITIQDEAPWPLKSGWVLFVGFLKELAVRATLLAQPQQIDQEIGEVHGGGTTLCKLHVNCLDQWPQNESMETGQELLSGLQLILFGVQLWQAMLLGFCNHS